ncbi:MAG: hypothetical protein ACOYMP_11385 [Nodosilinea sp.]
MHTMIYALPPVIPHAIVITANQADCKRGSRDCFPRDRSGWRSPTHSHDQSSVASVTSMDYSRLSKVVGLQP